MSVKWEVLEAAIHQIQVKDIFPPSLFSLGVSAGLWFYWPLPIMFNRVK